MEPAHSETGDCRVEPPASILVARLSMSHLVPLLEFNQGEVEFSITAWTANARTIAALERQAKRDGYKSVFEYLNVTITSMLLSDEETTLLADDGRIMYEGFGWDGGYPKDV